MAEAMRQTVVEQLKGIERYNPENLVTLEKYVEYQARENAYDLEANLATLKLYQLNPQRFNVNVTCQILLKALTNLPHTDFVLCKCLLSESIIKEPSIKHIMHLSDTLERCNFELFWSSARTSPHLYQDIVGFEDSIRKFVCHVIGITFQTIEKALLSKLLGDIDDSTVYHWVRKYGWSSMNKAMIFIANQDDNIKTKNITEKIDFENIAGLMASCL